MQLQSKINKNGKVWAIRLIYFFRFGGLILFAGVAFAVKSFCWSSHNFHVPNAAIRIVGISSHYQILSRDRQISHILYSPTQQRDFMSIYASRCYSNDLINRYDDLPNRFKEQLFKFCVLYMGHGNVWLDESVLLIDGLELLDIKDNIGIELQSKGMIHSSFLKVNQRKLPILRDMIQILLETSNHILQDTNLLVEVSLFNGIKIDIDKWTIWNLSCVTLTDELNPRLADTISVVDSKARFAINSDASSEKVSVMPLTQKLDQSWHCPIKGGLCCQAMNRNGESVIAVKHPIQGFQESADDSIYVAAVSRFILDHPQEVTVQMTPNFFDILLKNDCLPTQKQCHKCLKKMGTCDNCIKDCPCYCHALCRIRPPSKVIVEEWRVKLPKHKKDPSRLIPRIIHQTWYESVTKEKYPNMSRLIESFKQSGWEYQFYDDESAALFLKMHFPPQVLEAYKSIIPGAFKADLFRYCILLIHGGIYADMDVLLESHLDNLVTNDIGFMVPIDEPGSKVGHRSCLWNGLLAVAPGHPFLAKTIELVVNNIRNRFTSVDIDDMLCPNPKLSVSHSVDTLFTCGPCILGAGMNAVLGRHMQSEWEIGDVDIWSFEKNINAMVFPDDPRSLIPGRTIILNQNKQDMGAHRFTWLERNLMVAATDMPDYDDRPPEMEHYSKTHEKVGVFGLKKLYRDGKKANEEIKIIVEK